MKLFKLVAINISIIVVVILAISVFVYMSVDELKVPPELYVKMEGATKVKCIKGGYNWNYLGRHTVADALHPTQMTYAESETIYVKPDHILTFTNTSNHNMYNEDIRYYDKDLKEIILTTEIVPAVMETNVVSFNAPDEVGTYILSVTMNYYDRGSVQYGVKVVVTNDVPSLEPYVNTYVGDASRVSAILNSLPYCNYRKGIELITSKQPYGIIINYSNIDLNLSKLQFNTLALFTLIPNVDTITYNIQNNDKTDTYTVTRDEVKDKDLTINGLKNYNK